MAKYIVKFNNTAGVLDERTVETESDEDGLSFSKFIFAVNDMLSGTPPLYDGDTFTIECEEER